MILINITAPVIWGIENMMITKRPLRHIIDPLAGPLHWPLARPPPGSDVRRRTIQKNRPKEANYEEKSFQNNNPIKGEHHDKATIK